MRARARPKPRSSDSAMAARKGPRELRLGESMECLLPFGSAHGYLRLQATQALRCLFECVAPSREVKAQPLPPGRWIGVEARSGHRGHSPFFDEMACKRYVIRKAERRDVRHHVVRPAGRKRPKPRGFEGRHQQVAA